MSISMRSQDMCSSISQIVRHELQRFDHGMRSTLSASYHFFHL